VRQLKEVQKNLKDVRRTTIWALLPELMALDTEKHIRILEFLHEHTKQTAHKRFARRASHGRPKVPPPQRVGNDPGPASHEMAWRSH
jgi:hypothetical protein